ncbi:MAG: DUF115 domain-containing protein [Treponema sp.]|jgi:hypothetical protein|nr:DUF115 domain-containing protein [Treponema sp.]
MKAEKVKSLHSRYNPQLEAERYIGSLSLNENARFIVLIEPGHGYIAPPLKKKIPGAKIIALHAEKHEDARHGYVDAEWFPETGISIQDFLEREIPDSEAAEIQLLEWRPALAVYGEAYLRLVEEAVNFIKRTDANARTVKTFGHRWFRNFFKNLGLAGKVILPAPLSCPLLVTGAGPGLETAIPVIRKERDRLFILAASSSAAALKAENLVPDMVISTDGSPWAKYHLYGFFREDGNAGRPLALSLTAAIPSQAKDSPVLFISDGSVWQTLILTALEIPFITLPQRGTVSATALDLAFVLTKGEVFLAGMDLGNRDIRSHARPYSFDRFIDEKAGRFAPAYSQTYRRSSMLKAGGSYGIYASWFEKQLESYPKRLHSLGENNSIFDTIETEYTNLTTEEILPQTTRTSEEKRNPRTQNFTEKNLRINPRNALAILERALENPGLSSKLEEELKALLFKTGSAVSRRELIDTVYSLAGFRRGGINA